MSLTTARAAHAESDARLGSEGRRQRAIAAAKARREGNLVDWFEDEIENGKNIPAPVRAHLRRLFVKAGPTKDLDDAAAQAIAYRIVCRMNWLVAQHRLMSTSPEARHYLTLSKVAAHWATMERKLCGAKELKSSEGKRLKPVPTSPHRPTESDEDEGDTDYAEERD